MFQKASKQFSLVKIGLLRVALPQGLQFLHPNTHPAYPVVVERNRASLGRVEATGYTPAAVVTAGAARRTKYLHAGVVKTWVLAEKGLEIRADDEIGCNELMSRLRDELFTKICGRAGTAILPGQDWPSIQEVYPFENYLIYAYQGKKYRQHFALDPVERIVHLINGATLVVEKYVSASVETMPRVQTGVKYAFAPPHGNNQTMTQGAKNSELVLCIVRNWKNINEAAAMYVNAVKTGLRKPMTPSFCPVRLTGDNKIDDGLKAAGIADVYDFAIWSAEAQHRKTKSVGSGEEVGKKDFLWTPTDDPSTWKLPVHNASHVRNALARVNQTQGIPAEKKAGLMQRLHHMAKKHGIETHPSMKQQNWEKKGGHSHGTDVKGGGPGSGPRPGAGSDPYAPWGDHPELSPHFTYKPSGRTTVLPTRFGK